MPRLLKKFLYGLLYLSIIGLIAWGVYGKYFTPTLTCTDGLLNQGEEQIDCGGPCIPCELRDLELGIGGVDVIKVGDKTSFVVEIENVSHNYGAIAVPYDVSITDPIGASIQRIRGTFSVYPGDTVYVVESGLDINADNVGEVVFSLDDFEFVSADDLVGYDIDIEDIVVSFPEGAVLLEGVVINDSGFDVKQLRLKALFYSPSGELVNAGATLLSGVKAFEGRDFAIQIPQSEGFIDAGQTVVSWEVIE